MKEMKEKFPLLLCLVFKAWLASGSIGLRCDMIPEGVTTPRCTEDPHRYRIEISGNPESYVPGEQYTVFLRSGGNGEEAKNKFTHFILSVSAEKEKEMESIGSLQLYGDSSTRFSDGCANAVVEANSEAKSEIQVLWLAPSKGSGCIKFKATVVESMDVWFSEEGDLTKVLCEEAPDSEDTQPKILRQCCTCDEAKYESDHIRTIIKARGISYPNITGKTFAVFRVDNKHHLMSIVSMIDPSPDWIVGVSSLELCLRNCSWVESKVLNLYPWDVGTDDGLTYLAPNQPSSPRQPIRRLKTNQPNDPRSPFYDPTGAELKPLARLTLSRQRLYEKTCDPNSFEEPDDEANCETEAWSDWSPCSATCGRGVKYKQRRYKNEESKYICHKKLTERAGCEAVQKYCPHQPSRITEDPLCELGPWSQWSSCSVTCGKGTKTRDRKYKNRFAAKSCAVGKFNPPKLQENLECVGEGKCDDFEEELNENCPEKPWSDWSPCSATCGTGFKERYRLSLEFTGKEAIYWPFYKKFEDGEDIDEEDPCNQRKMKETVECYEKPCIAKPLGTSVLSGLACSLPKDVGACKSSIDRWYFDGIKGNCEIFSYSGCEGNANNFNTLEQCQTLCANYQKELIANFTAKRKELDVTVSGVLSYNIQNDKSYDEPKDDAILKKPDLVNFPKIDCVVSEWSSWSRCITSKSCGFGDKIKTRYIKVRARNGGKMCPSKLIKRRKCFISCLSKKEEAFKESCKMSPWSEWSSCPQYCKTAEQKRYRLVLEHPERVHRCPHKVETRACDCKL